MSKQSNIILIGSIALTLFSLIGCGAAEHSNTTTFTVNDGKEWIEIIEEHPNRFLVRFTNREQNSVFLFFDNESPSKEQFVPYNMECAASPGKEWQTVSQNYHFLPSMNDLGSNKNILFTVDKPDMDGECIISVVYYDDDRAARLINEKLPFLDESDRELLSNLRKERNVKVQVTSPTS